MAYASWVTPNKTSGNGNDTVSWTGSVYTGRVARSTTATFAASGCDNKTLAINQAGKSEFVDEDDTGSVAQTGGTLTVSGVSNSSKLTFSLSNNGIGLTLPQNYTAGGVSTRNGVAISGDPGASQQYEFSIQFANIQANPGVSTRTTQLTVTDAAGHTDTCLITQAAGAAYLTISPNAIDLNADGAAVSMSVTSNTSWTIS